MTTRTEREIRKALVRQRLEMQRQQVHFHIQPLLHPLGQVKSVLTKQRSIRQEPLMLAATAVLALFGRRLGRLGTLARIGVTLYPLIRIIRSGTTESTVPDPDKAPYRPLP